MSKSNISEKEFCSLIPLNDFKSILGIDDREDKTARFCLVTATCTIEQYCKRRLLRKKHFEHTEFSGDLLLPLREYPVNKILAIYTFGSGEILEPEFYSTIPDCSQFSGIAEDLPFSLSLSPALLRYKNLKSIKVVYTAGYEQKKTPADLSAACLELAAWNMSRYKGRRIGMTGNIRGVGKDVRLLLEPYKRRTI